MMKVVNRRKLSRYEAKEHLGNFFFLLPTLILFTVVVLIPFFQGIPYSFMRWKEVITPPTPYFTESNTLLEKIDLSLKSYRFILDPKTGKTFLTSIRVTFAYTGLYLIFTNVMGFALALLINKSSRFNNVSRTVFFLPFTTSVTAGAIIWAYLFSDIFAPIFQTVSPLYNDSTTVLAMAIMASWRDMGYTMLIYIAALQTIPAEYYEAATMDGANAFQKFRSITIPLIVPAFTTNITLILAWGLRTFDLPAVVSQTRTAGQTTAYYVYSQIFMNKGASVGQAAAILLTIILIILTQVVTRVLRRLEVEA